MDAKNLIIVISGAINLLLGIIVFSKGKNSLTNKVYGFLAVGVAYWDIGMILYRMSPTIEGSIFWCRVLYTAPIFIVSFFLYFSYIFPVQKKVGKLIIANILFCGSLVFFTSIFSDLIVKDVVFNQGAEKTIIWGKFYFFYTVYISCFFLWSYIVLLLKRKEFINNGLIKSQINYVFWGTFVSSTLGMFTNLLLPTFGFFYFNWAGQVLSVIMAIFIAYAIIVHRLMDIKLVLRQYSVLLLSFTVIVVPAAFIIKFYEEIIPQYKVLVNLAILFLAVYFFPICRDYFYRLSNKYLFSSLYDSAQVIAKLSDKLRSTLYLEKVYDYIYESLNGAFHLKSFGILSFDEKKGTYFIRYNHGFDAGGVNEFESVSSLEKTFIKQNKPIVVDEIKPDNRDNKAKRLLISLRKMGVAILMPLSVKDKIVGLLVLGQKESGDIFNSEDYKVLDVVSAQSAIAIENAMLYDESQKFTVKLEKEVENATKELRSANEKLKKLDESKSEFISIASHQLRTPLTVTKGYVSMILEGSFGKISAVQRDSLDKVYQSNERLIRLVENLLNLSRIESGRLQFKYETMNLETIVDSVVEELTQKAKEKKLKFEYKKPAKLLPKITIDQEKIRQVVMNIIDNSIKYTAKGSVTVSLKKEENNIEFCVSDTGMGIEAEDLPRLFQKFQRGTGTFLVHTEGTGLGLYVAREMIEQHKGKIWAESKGKNKGSKFIFTIPINNV